jgi:hypothetical protein
VLISSAEQGIALVENSMSTRYNLQIIQSFLEQDEITSIVEENIKVMFGLCLQVTMSQVRHIVVSYVCLVLVVFAVF